ncbi:radical SAM/SPASM domain-containing protein [Ruegeria sp. ANG-S4]|uniref:radical SAM/SPASM domain-containing protein n=1 Tax=Ruegeria sp. ANG-S4 TaxID=1577904 RepID=UPI000B2C7A62|nr:radical SAM protein [Ruegeria sp. ANG-S4]
MVWETTLACNLKCKHCGSRAGTPRKDELSTEDAFGLIDELADLGTREITLIGGELFLRKDWLKLVERISSKGILCTMQSGGFHLTRERLKDAKEAGLAAIGISIDGLEKTHNSLRGVRTSFQHALRSLEAARDLHITSNVNTTITSKNIDELELLYEVLKGFHVRNWQFQIVVAMGNAADEETLLFQPYQITKVLDSVARIRTSASRVGMLVQASNALGYFGPYEWLWERGSDTDSHWSSCGAGQSTMGIEADGTIKACPSLATEDFGVTPSEYDTLQDLWIGSDRIRFNETRDPPSGSICGACYYWAACKGGCSWATHSLTGTVGENPYCHYRAICLSELGLKEKIRKVRDAPGSSFDRGEFEVVIEDEEGKTLKSDDPRKHRIIEKISAGREQGASEEALKLCTSCHQFAWEYEKQCPFCSGTKFVSTRALKSIKSATKFL